MKRILFFMILTLSLNAAANPFQEASRPPSQSIVTNKTPATHVDAPATFSTRASASKPDGSTLQGHTTHKSESKSVETLPQEQRINKPQFKPVRIGIILPLEHQALNEIVKGLEETLPKVYKEPVEFKVMNAQGDQNMQRAIIQQMKDQDYKVIVPIATGVTQMTLAIIHNKPVVSLAADITEEDRKKMNPCNVVVVHDEIPPRRLLEFLHTAYPKIKSITLIHSTSDKVVPDVKATVAAGNQYGIEVKPVMVATLPELVSAAQSLSKKTQGIFILKDNLIASGAPTLAKVATDKHIPLFTSDEGSIEAGGGFALGVHEKQIGEEGAKLVAAALLGDSLSRIDNVTMTNLTVFINRQALQQAQQTIDTIESAAKQHHYQVEYVDGKSGHV